MSFLVMEALEGIAIDREEDDGADVIVGSELSLSADPDARWLKKGKKSFFGYKGFIVTDSVHGAIHEVHVTPANVSEVRTLEAALSELKPKRLYADKGYASAQNRETLKEKKIRDGIMHKAAKNKPLAKAGQSDCLQDSTHCGAGFWDAQAAILIHAGLLYDRGQSGGTVDCQSDRFQPAQGVQAGKLRLFLTKVRIK